MKTIIAGSRKIPLIVFDLIFPKVLEELNWEITEVVSGMANGPDKYGLDWAIKNNVAYTCFPANWRRFKKAAGIYRNWEMGEYADAAIILWDGESTGTLSMIDIMKRLNKPYKLEYIYKKPGS